MTTAKTKKTEKESSTTKTEKWAMTEDGGRLVVLKNPINWGDEEITEIVVPLPRVYHMRGFNVKKLETDTDEMFRLLQKLIAQPPKFLDLLSFSDAAALLEVAQDFLEHGKQTGADA